MYSWVENLSLRYAAMTVMKGEWRGIGRFYVHCRPPVQVVTPKDVTVVLYALFVFQFHLKEFINRIYRWLKNFTANTRLYEVGTRLALLWGIQKYCI